MEQIKVNGNEIWFLLIPLILPKCLCLCVWERMRCSFCFSVASLSVSKCRIETKSKLRNEWGTCIWCHPDGFDSNFFRSDATVRVSSFCLFASAICTLHTLRCQYLFSLLLLTPFLFAEPYFHNWMSFLFIIRLFLSISLSLSFSISLCSDAIFCVLMSSLSIFIFLFAFTFESVPENFTYDFLLGEWFDITFFFHRSASTSRYFWNAPHYFCSVTFEHMHIVEAENIQSEPYLGCVFCASNKSENRKKEKRVRARERPSKKWGADGADE